ncbi:MAG: S46 family peptidase [Crocinitomicaceae bacterium]
MKKSILVLIVCAFTFSAAAVEGMFMPFNLKQIYKDMKAAGLAMSYKKIYHEKKPSVSDAIVSLGGFCTAEIISSQGLMLTNHHCGYDAIREQSTPENDLLTDGFWAKSLSEERPIAGLTASIVVKIEDVSERINELLNDNLSEDERQQVIREESGKIIEEATEGNNYKAIVKPFFEGNEFYLFLSEVFKDVRLVGAPPSSIGKYGGDTDNWMWIRHTGDFSMFRIYANADNKPALFDKNNKPYQPKHHLPVSIKGIQNGDFTMIMGYPGSTDRYLTARGVKMAVEQDQPSRVKARAKKLDIMKADMKASDAVRLQYASNYAQVSNYWKYFIGQTEQLKRNNVYSKKKAIENSFSNWAKSSPDRQKKYGSVLTDIEESYSVLSKYNPSRVYFYEAVYSIPYNTFLIRNQRLYNTLKAEEQNDEQLEKIVAFCRQIAESSYAGFNYGTEQKLVANLLKMYLEEVPKSQFSTELMNVYQKSKTNVANFVELHMKNSIFSSKENYLEFLDNPSAEVMREDKLFVLMTDMFDNFRKMNSSEEVKNAKQKLDQANRLFISALREMNPDKKYYPNANSTLRLSYGNVGRYKKSDGLLYDFYTTIEGLMAKENPNDDEFIVPSRLKELYNKKDYGRYAANGTLPVNFISDNDITGGNSGSPVMNAKGELIGCAFDGNWEAMSGDIAFEKSLQRTISVDIRYVLFVIDKYAGATNLIEEMTIVE